MIYLRPLILLAIPLTLHAQKTDTLNEIVVTASPALSGSVKNPVAIVAVQAKAIDSTNLFNITTCW